MSKKGQVDLNFLRRLEQRRFEKRLAEKARKKLRNRRRNRADMPGRTGPLGPPVRGAKGGPRGGQQWHDILMPASLDLVNGREETCGALFQLRKLVRAGYRARLIFAATEEISPEALIFLLGQVQRIRIEYGLTQVNGTYPNSKRVERLLEDSGFFQLLGVQRRSAVTRRSNATRYLKCKSNTEIVGSDIPKIRDELLGSDLAMPPPIGKKVFRALTEAMTNVKHHAYASKNIKSHKLDGRWWMAAQLNLRKQLFTLTFYDAGVGLSLIHI